MGMQMVTVPEKGEENPIYESESYTEFTAVKKLCAHEYAIYADFESILCPTFQTNENDNLQKLAEHTPCGFGYVVLEGNKVRSKQVYRGEDTIRKFFRAIRSEVRKIKEI